MHTQTALTVSALGEKMRNAQKLYFQLSAVAKKSKTTESYAAASNQLKVSKELEKVFDETVQQVINNTY